VRTSGLRTAKRWSSPPSPRPHLRVRSLSQPWPARRVAGLRDFQKLDYSVRHAFGAAKRSLLATNLHHRRLRRNKPKKASHHYQPWADFWEPTRPFAICFDRGCLLTFNDAMNSYVWALSATLGGWCVSSR
jgi:hypothetical protein